MKACVTKEKERERRRRTRPIHRLLLMADNRRMMPSLKKPEMNSLDTTKVTQVNSRIAKQTNLAKANPTIANPTPSSRIQISTRATISQSNESQSNDSSQSNNL